MKTESCNHLIASSGNIVGSVGACWRMKIGASDPSPQSIAVVFALMMAVLSVAAQPNNSTRLNYPNRPGAGDRNTLWSREAIRYDRAFSRILSAAEDLAKADEGEEWQRSLKQLTSDATFLQQRWREWLTYNEKDYELGATVDRYYEGLTADHTLLEKASKEEDRAKALDLVRAAEMDLNAKAENCQNSDDGLGKVVQVRVRTMAGTNEVSGYEVWFVTRGMIDVESAHDRFSKLSSPTDELNLAPGGYALWVRTDQFTSDRTAMRVGGKGQKQIEIDLSVTLPRGAENEAQ